MTISNVKYGVNVVTNALAKNAADLSTSSDFEEIGRAIVVPLLTGKGDDWQAENEVRIITKAPGPLAIDRAYLLRVCFGLATSDRDRKLIIPLGGDLSPIPDHIKELYSIAKNVRMNVTKFSGSNTFVESSAPYKMVTCFFDLAPKNNEDWQVMQLRWVKERNEWVATAYKEELWGFDDCEEFYEGPFAIDEYCADRLGQLYSIPASQLNNQDISRTSPFDLKYAATLNSITEIPPELMTIFTCPNIVDCLKRQYLSYLNELPFKFSADNNHVWQVLEALDVVLDNNHGLFSKDKEGGELNKDIFGEFVSIAHDLQNYEGMVKQIWIAIFLHDIAKHSVLNADHALISENLVRDLFETNDWDLTEQERERITWVIGNHDVVGNIVSSAERAPRCLIERLTNLSNKEKQTRLNMLILLSFCDLRGTSNGKFVNDYNAKSRFRAADFSWLKQKEEDLFKWRKERLVRAHKQENTKEKQELWDEAFSGLWKETKSITKNQFGKNIKVFTNLLYLALVSP
ncbi:hypothetical protein ES703_121042 [subsurface metagenome]